MKFRLIIDELIPVDEDKLSSVFDVQRLATRAMDYRDFWRDADGVLLRSKTDITPELLKGSKVTFIGSATVGTDHLKVGADFLKEQKIMFAHAPKESTESVVAWTVAVLLELMDKHKAKLADIKQKTIGIIGVGNIGSRMEEIFKVLKAKEILLCDPKFGKKSVPFEEVVKKADILLFHPSYQYEGEHSSHYLISEDNWESLKKDVLVINASRGAVTSNAALKEALSKKQIKGLALDVYENEPKTNFIIPPLPYEMDSDLLKVLDIGTPHIAGHSMDGKHLGADKIVKDAAEFFKVKGLEDYESPITFKPEPEIEITEFDVEKDLLPLVQKLMKIDYTSKTFLEKPEDIPPNFTMIRRNYTRNEEFQRRDFNYYTVKPKDFTLKPDDAKLLKALGFKVG
jgi:erythronate-4-phosphate dehydrogenase